MQASQHSLRRLKFAALTVAISAAASQAQAPLDVRIALVMGNSAYIRDDDKLANASNDATAMAVVLRKSGFDVVQVLDGTKAQMQAAVDKVSSSLKGKQGIGLLFFAGHGMQLDWRNYMMPVNVAMQKPADIPLQNVDVGGVIESFKNAGTRMNIMVLDACRNNPFGSITSGKGLAPIDAPPGTILAYSTAPGNLAEDGDVASGNGLYTQYLLQEMSRPMARIEDVFKKVRFQVRQKSAGRQIPWESTSLEDDFFFNDGTAPRPVKLADAPEKVKAEVFAEEKQAWDRIRDSKTAGDVYAFLQKYPNGMVSELAQAKIAQIEPPKIVAQADRQGVAQTDQSMRFRKGDQYDVVVKDLLTKVEVQRASYSVVSIKDDIVEFNNGYKVTLSGAIVTTLAGATLDPYQQWIPGSEYQVGKRWYTRSMLKPVGESAMWVELQGKIVARETVQVPAGEFDTYKMEMQQTAQDGTRLKVTYWGQPDWGVAVKQIREVRDTRGRLSGQTIELVKRVRGTS